MSKPITICITGPESTGKTSLAKALAEELKAEWVPEYAREYLEKLDRGYCYEDLALIADGQKHRQSIPNKNARFVVFDTSLLTVKIWGLDKFGKYPLGIDEEILKENIDLYLLCRPDLPWKADPQREDENRREAILLMYEQQLAEQKSRWAYISGAGSQRLQNALSAIDKF